MQNILGQKEEMVLFNWIVQDTDKKVGNGICLGCCCGQKEMLAPNLTGSQVSEYIFFNKADGAYLNPFAWLKHAVTIDVEMKCIMTK